MNAGVIITDNTDKESYAAFLGDKLQTYAFKTNEELLELIAKHDPRVIAFDAGTETSMKEFNKNEEELKEEGHSFVPTSHEPRRSKRVEALKTSILHNTDKQVEVIRFEPKITADELALHDDSGLEALGIDPSGIESAGEFDAVLGAVTSRFYSQNQFEDYGVIVPEALE